MVNYHSWNATDREKGKCTEKINLKCISKINFLPLRELSRLHYK